MLYSIIGISVLAIFSIVLIINKYRQDEFIDEIIGDYSDLALDFVKSLIKRDELRQQVEEQKDIISDLSKQINEATVKTTPDENLSETKTEEPKKETKTKTTKKTTTRKRTTKKKEVKE